MIFYRDRARFDRDTLTFTPREWGGIGGHQEDILDRMDYLKWRAETHVTDGGFLPATLSRMNQAHKRLRATVLGQTVDEAAFWHELRQEQDPRSQDWEDPRTLGLTR